jgi:hypothetical protein
MNYFGMPLGSSSSNNTMESHYRENGAKIGDL